jgi:hypothetical protein
MYSDLPSTERKPGQLQPKTEYIGQHQRDGNRRQHEVNSVQVKPEELEAEYDAASYVELVQVVVVPHHPATTPERVAPISGIGSG